MSETFCLADYDAYGFDLDHTLAKYKLVNLLRLCYESVCDCLIEKLGYPEKLKDDIDTHKDFICKGLFLDADRGNVLKLSHDGKILRCSHGTRMMTKEETVTVYGPDLHWEHFQHMKDNVKCSGADFKYRFFENYFDIPSLIACAHIVDMLDEENGGVPQDKYTFWKDVFTALLTNYVPTAFSDGSGWYFPKLKQNISNYVQECSEGVKKWLCDLRKEKKIVFLMTSSAYDYATLVLNVVLGEKWQTYFDLCLFNARKPGFFINKNPFLEINDGKEGSAVESGLQVGHCYSQGNHEELIRFTTSHTKDNPKIVYFGDSLCSDSFPANNFASWDVVLVLEEMEAEGYHLTTHDLDCDDEQPNSKVRKRQVNLNIDAEEERYLLSQCWGSFFYHAEEDVKHDLHMNTFWGRLVSQYNVIAIPLVEYIAGMPIDHVYRKFGKEVGSTTGFSPSKPKPLMA